MSTANTELIVVGRVGSPYGVRGWLRITSYTDPPDNIGQYQPWHMPGGVFKPLGFKPHQNGFVTQLAGIDDRDAAAKLAGQHISIDPAQLAPTQEDEFYWRDLMGLQVTGPGGEAYGVVQQLLETGVHDVLVVATPDGAEVLVPFVRKFVQRVDIKEKNIIVDWPEFDLSGG